MLGARLLVLLEPADDAASVVEGEEFGLVGEVLHHPEGDDADEDGDDALEDEDPRPAWLAAYAVHLGDGGGEEAAKGTGDRGGGEEDGGAHAELRALVPAGEVVVYAGEKAGFGQAEEPSGGGEAGEVVDEAHGGHADAPGEHDGRDEDGRFPAFEEDLGEGFEDGVGDEEDG